MRPQIDIAVEEISAINEPAIKKDSKRKYIKISITDNGLGFAQIYAESIFELFNRLHRNNNFEGKGTRLFICKKVVENHAGYIFAKSQPNEGATFTSILSA